MPALTDFLDRQRTYQPSEAAVRKEVRWTVNGARYINRPTLRSNAFVRMDPNAVQIVADLIAAVAPALGDAMNEHLGALALATFDGWPVETGLSKDTIGLSYRIENSGDTLVGELAITAPYAWYIREGRQAKRERRTLQASALRLIQRPPRDVTDVAVWRQAVVIVARRRDAPTYAECRAVYAGLLRRRGRERRRPRPRGKRIADTLVFVPGLEAAREIEQAFVANMGAA